MEARFGDTAKIEVWTGYLWRDDSRNATVLFRSISLDPTASSDDYDVDGPAIAIDADFGQFRSRLLFSQSDDEKDFSDPIGLSVGGDVGFGLFFVGGGTSANQSRDTQIAELDLLYEPFNWYGFTLGAGAKLLYLGDDITTNLSNTIATLDITSEASTSAAGPMVALGYELEAIGGSGLSIGAFASAALLKAKHSYDASFQYVDGIFDSSGQSDASESQWIGAFEADISARYRITDRASFGLGYKLRHVTDVASAGASQEASIFSTAPSSITPAVQTGSVTYHGAFANLTIKF